MGSPSWEYIPGAQAYGSFLCNCDSCCRGAYWSSIPSFASQPLQQSVSSLYASDSTRYGSGLSEGGSPLWQNQFASPRSPSTDLTVSPRNALTWRRTPKQKANFLCEVKGCGKLFTRGGNLKAHIETHNTEREYPFHCNVPGCSRKFVRNTDLQRHHQSVHLRERTHKCGHCPRSFSRKDTMRR